MEELAGRSKRTDERIPKSTESEEELTQRRRVFLKSSEN